MNRLIVTAAAFLAVIPARAQQWQQDKLQGQSSAISELKTVVVKTAADWQQLWKQHNPQAAQAPQVDFSREMVVGVFLGEKPKSGYKVELVVQNSPTDPKKLVVFYREIPPSNDGFSAQVISHPYELVKVPKKAVVDFEVNQRMGILPGEGAQTAPNAITPEQTVHINGVVLNLQGFTAAFDNR
jgi:hypothetical protein